MSGKADFTHEEWTLLRTLPAMAGIGVLAAERSWPVGAAKGGAAIVRALEHLAAHPPPNQLMGELADEMRPRVADDVGEVAPGPGAGRAEVADNALAAAARGAALVRQRATDEEASSYLSFVVETAGAAADGPESTYLRRVAEALAVER